MSNDELYTGTPFPKYQWSAFVGGNRNEQFVIRCNDAKEFAGEVKTFKKIAKIASNAPTPEVEPTQPLESGSESQERCKQCKGPMEFRQGTGKTGKPWKAYFCVDKCGVDPSWVG